MYITNIDELQISPEKLYKCNGVIASWLEEKNFPLLGKSVTGEFVFAKTELLLEVLESIPFYLKISKLFS